LTLLSQLTDALISLITDTPENALTVMTECCCEVVLIGKLMSICTLNLTTTTYIFI